MSISFHELANTKSGMSCSHTRKTRIGRGKQGRRDRMYPTSRRQAKDPLTLDLGTCTYASTLWDVVPGRLCRKEAMLVGHVLLHLVKIPCGVSLAQANEGSGGGEGRHKMPRLKAIFPILQSLHLLLPTSRSEKRHPSQHTRVGRYGLTVLD